MAEIGTTADIGHLGKIDWNSNQYDFIEEVNGPSLSTDSVETTHSQSTSAWKEFIPGLKDAGEVTARINFDPDEPVIQDATVRSLVITFPPGSGQSTGATFTCDAFVTGASVAIPIGDRMTQEVTWKFTGVPVWADGS